MASGLSLLAHWLLLNASPAWTGFLCPSYYFRDVPDDVLAPGYSSTIERPVSLSTIERRLQARQLCRGCLCRAALRSAAVPRLPLSLLPPCALCLASAALLGLSNDISHDDGALAVLRY